MKTDLTWLTIFLALFISVILWALILAAVRPL